MTYDKTPNPNPNPTLTLTLIALQKDEWIDKATRIVIVDFTMYNPEKSLHVTTRLAFEFIPSGECFPSARVNAYKCPDPDPDPDPSVLP